MKQTFKIILAACLMTCSLGAYSAGPKSPVPMLRQVSTTMIAELKGVKSADEAKAYQAIEGIVLKHLVPKVDRTRMARSVIGRRFWSGATKAQQTTFIKLFTNMVVATYTTALQSYSDQKVTFLPLRVNPAKNETVEVKSQIASSHGSPISVVYEMIYLTDGGWKIYDFSVDGVGIVSSYRSQFSDVLANQGFQALLDRMKAHNEEDD